MSVFEGMDKAPTPQVVHCPVCGALMSLRRGAYFYFYSCPNFRDSLGGDAFLKNTDDTTPVYLRHGYEPNCADVIPAEFDGMPFTLEKRERIRRARHAAHLAFDRIWKGTDTTGRLMTRTAAYKWLRKQLRVPRDGCHIGMFDVDTCGEVVRVCQEYIYRVARGAISRKAHLSNYARKGEARHVS